MVEDDIVVIDWVAVFGLEVVSVMILCLIVDDANGGVIDLVVVTGLEVVSVMIL